MLSSSLLSVCMRSRFRSFSSWLGLDCRALTLADGAAAAGDGDDDGADGPADGALEVDCPQLLDWLWLRVTAACAFAFAFALFFADLDIPGRAG
mmetsp:Transcript_13269/g.37253  ORF Transcript_13269/g.37253 Transcript_13269/m.37253 type:complete len:94 (+) Transcript_13269:3471-3752(+)